MRLKPTASLHNISGRTYMRMNMEKLSFDLHTWWLKQLLKTIASQIGSSPKISE